MLQWAEDLQFADCIHKVFPTFIPNSTKDKWNRETFLPSEPNSQMKMTWGEFAPWYWKGKDSRTTNEGIHLLSSRPVIFHYLKKPQWFYFLDHFIFDVCVDPYPTK